MHRAFVGAALVASVLLGGCTSPAGDSSSPTATAATPSAAVSATPVSSLACPKTVPADRRNGLTPWVPAAPRGLDGSGRLAPLRVPARVVICAYIGPGSPAGKSGSVLLTGDLSGVMNDLAWAPPTPAARAMACTANIAATDRDYYLIGLSYPGSTQWVAAPGNHCAGSSNGVFFSSTARLSGRASAWYKAQHWIATPNSNAACIPSFGRLGQESRMVPGHPVSVSVCEESTPGGVKAPQRTETSGAERLASALNALRTNPWQSTCTPQEKPPFTRYHLVFGYAQGPSLNVTVVPNCRVINGSLQANDVTTVLPLIQELLPQR